MPGAVITINQPTGAGSGTPGVARRDLWLSRQIELVVGTSGNSSIEWAIISGPPGSAATLTNHDQATCTFTPDVIGTYRIQLVTNGGGPGNISIKAARVRFDTTGVLGGPSGLGWALPGLGEVDGESNYSIGMVTNLRAWAEVWEGIVADIQTITSKTLPFPTKLIIPGISGLQETGQSTGDEKGAIAFDPSVYGPTNTNVTRSFRFVAVLECAKPAQTCSLELFNITDGSTVVTLTTSNQVATTVTSAALTVPSDLPNSMKLYGLRLKRTGATSADLVSCKMARLEVIYQ